MTDTPLLIAQDGAVVTLTLHRPHAGNTIDLPLAVALRAAVARCDGDPTVRCVVLTGAGKVFCGGGDLARFAAAGDTVPDYLRELAETLHQAVAILMRMAKPLVVLVNGPAAGAGLSLAIAGDVVLAARSAHFTAAYASVGLSPDGGMSWHLPRVVGLRRAQEMIIANRRVLSDEAEAIGLVTRTVDDADLMAEGRACAAQLAAGPTLAIGGARCLLLQSYAASLEETLDRERETIVAMGATADCREGVAAFAARRQPAFSGAR